MQEDKGWRTMPNGARVCLKDGQDLNEAFKSNREIKNYQRRDDHYQKLVNAEPEISKDMKQIDNNLDAELLGYEFRIKSKESYDEKYERKTKEKGRHYEAQDVVRYTFKSKSENSYVEDFNNVVRELEKTGYNLTEVTNHWLNPRNPYNGINFIVEKNKIAVELQLHTLKSLEVKEKQHVWYDKLKVAKSDEKDDINVELFKLSKSLTPPKNIEKVRNKK